MDRKPVDSSSIAAAGYAPDVSMLEVEFRNGSVYQYFAVPKEVFDSLLAAESKGAFVSSHIRGCYPFRKVPD